jgi:hypothetical protein
VTARIPGEHVDAIEGKLVDDMLQTPRMFVTTMEEHDAAAVLDRLRRGPAAIEEFGAVVGDERVLFGKAFACDRSDLRVNASSDPASFMPCSLNRSPRCRGESD